MGTISTPVFYSTPSKKSLNSSFSSLSNASRVQSFHLVTRQLSIRRGLLVLAPKASSDQPGQDQEDEVVDSNVLPYCSLDRKQKKSVGEMEQEFLQALQSFYYEGKAMMSNEEFDNLKEELMWEGSDVVMLSSDEQRFLEVSMAYLAGQPIMTDKEFDELKMKLKGSCPNCGSENTSFFGTILSITSGGPTTTIKCSGCGMQMVFDSKTRLITLPEGR